MEDDTDCPVVLHCPVCSTKESSTALQLESGEVQCSICGCPLSWPNVLIE